MYNMIIHTITHRVEVKYLKQIFNLTLDYQWNYLIKVDHQ